MRLIGVLTLLVITVTATACGARYKAGDQWFDEPEKAIAHYRALAKTRISEQVSPRSAPLGGPAVIVVPTRAQLTDLARTDVPDADPRVHNYAAGIAAVLYEALTRAIDRRALFTEVRMVRAINPSGLKIPAKGYLIWIEHQPGGDGTIIHMAAAGELETTLVYAKGTDKKTDVKGIWEELFGKIEAFIGTHPAKG